jgi:hypothetical protein
MNLIVNYNIQVNKIRLDNSGENKTLQKKCEHLHTGIKFEFTAPGTPQQNSLVERKFSTLIGRARSMMTEAGLRGAQKQMLWCEVAHTATKLNNIMVKDKTEKSPYFLFYGEDPKYQKHLKIFGEMAVIASHANKKTRTKLEDRGRTAMFIGYSDDHEGNVYRFVNIKTYKIVLSRDAQWLNILWKDYIKKKNEIESQLETIEIGDVDDHQEEKEVQEESVDSEEETTEIAPREVQNLQHIEMSGFETENLGRTRSETRELMSPRQEAMERAECTLQQFIEETCYVSSMISNPEAKVPINFQEAWDHPDTTEKKLWREAIKGEFKHMIEKKVWRKVKRRDIPTGRRLIGNKWVFLIKRDGRHRARLVALGYSQIPGVDYTDNFAPVANDVTFRVALVRLMQENLSYMQMDVQTAFLYGELTEEIYMEAPTGLHEVYQEGEDEEDCYLLTKGIYGLVQAARQYWKTFTSTMTGPETGFTISEADPCLLFRENELGICMVIIYVDDMLIIGHRDSINNFKKDLLSTNNKSIVA